MGMIYNLSNKYDLHEAEENFKFHKKQAEGKESYLINLGKKNKKRTIKQNAYLHKLFALYGCHFGWSVDEAKIEVKRELKYVYKKNGKTFLKKTSKMDTKELTIFIEKFRNFSNDNGYYLPSADEYLFDFARFERQIANNEIYL